MIKKISILLAFGLAFTLPSAFASTIVAGQTAPPDIFTNTSANYTLVGQTIGDVNPVPGTSFNGQYVEDVVKDTGNVFCSGCLDFIIQMHNAGPGIVERVSTSAFDGFLTDVGYNSMISQASWIAPQTVDRSNNGQVIGFNFIPPGSNVGSGQDTMYLEIETNATSFVPGFVSIQDGQAGTGPGFQPTSVPEPISMSLLGGGLALLGLARLRRTGKKA